MRSRPKSQKVYKDLCKVIPAGVNSPVRAFKSLNQLPLVVQSGKGDKITDVDGNEYIDYCGSWGSLIHGHAHPKIVNAVKTQVKEGSSFGITTPIEGELARKIVKHVKGIEKVRFVSSGTEATMSAARLARGATGRPIIVKFIGNYHGHADFFLIKAGSGVMGLGGTSSSAGIPEEIVKNTVNLPYNDVEACRAFLNDSRHRKHIAAVILEPIAGNMGVVPASPEFIQMLRRETEKIGALLILDEVITGFRVSRGGAQELYGVTPDLTCLGKIIGGGFPAAAFGGRADLMDHLAPLGNVYQAGTLSGNPVAMAAGVEALTLLEQKGFYEALEKKTVFLTEPIERALKKTKKGCLQRCGSMFTIFLGPTEVVNGEQAEKLDGELFRKFFQFLFERGIYIPPSPHEAWFVSSAHSLKSLKRTRDVLLEFLEGGRKE